MALPQLSTAVAAGLGSVAEEVQAHVGGREGEGGGEIENVYDYTHDHYRLISNFAS